MQTGNFSTFQAAYTWSHSIANVELNNSSGTINQQAITDQSNPGLDKGNTNINRPNIFVANWVAFLPKLEGQNQWVRQTIGSWEFNSILTLAEGSNLTIFTNGGVGGAPVMVNGVEESSGLSSLAGTGYINNQRPLQTSLSCTAGRGGDTFVNLQHFTLNGYALGTFPSNLAPRGSCQGAPNTNMDAQLAKNWVIKEKYRIKFSMDFFNLFNHANFNSSNLEGSAYNPSAPLYCGGADATHGTPCSPSNNIVSGMVGSSTTGNSVPVGVGSGFGQASAVAPGRTLQYTFRFTF